MSVATKQTTKHFVDLWARETILRRRRIVIEAPAGWDASRLANLDGGELSRLADEYGCEADWEIEEAEDWEDSSSIDVAGPVADDITPDIVFKVNKVGDLIEAESGEPATFTL